ncbi:cyanamide hydratase [Aspergillus ruber CBS 135680]|uniref:Cyanamide hydratase n=1 Tax=Aspergillus ruber (strain CBS 135680) TaxID=1388766 RepID=A0A017SAL4_ASPRC|nr:cyanamide hydratase [Aspergillus ruber CBS 135680]EYE94043.1 cyanamide hydratase [Aspergillus ruber CBS 135680]
MSTRTAQVEEYGWGAVPINPKEFAPSKAPKPHLVKDTPLPETQVAKAALEYAKAELPAHTFNHSMRVFYYGLAIARQHFPSWKFSDETWLLTCLFHDIGTIDKYTRDVFMSFDIYGGVVALNVLKEQGAPSPQAESVAEAVMRHQDSVRVGAIHTVGLLIQLATQFDNIGAHKEYVHTDTVKDVTGHYPRRQWSKCFSSKLREEIGLKPWCHTTAEGESFPRDIEHNALMEPYDGLF